MDWNKMIIMEVVSIEIYWDRNICHFCWPFFKTAAQALNWSRRFSVSASQVKERNVTNAASVGLYCCEIGSLMGTSCTCVNCDGRSWEKEQVLQWVLHDSLVLWISVWCWKDPVTKCVIGQESWFLRRKRHRKRERERDLHLYCFRSVWF